MLANYLTIARLFLVIPIIISVRADNYMLALFFFFLAALTDYLDGYIARKYNQETVLGKFLDPLADKILYLALLLFFLEKNYISTMPFVFILLRELTALTYGPIVLLKGGDIQVGKFKNLFQFGSVVLIIILGKSYLSDLFLWLSVAFTLVSGWVLYGMHYKEVNKIFKELR